MNNMTQPKPGGTTYTEKPKLNPPIFEVQLIDFTVKGIAFSHTVKKVKSRIWI